MRLDYQQANELYALLTENFHPEMKSDETILKDLAAAINLIDECDKTQSARIFIDRSKKLVRVSMKFKDDWPKFLTDEINKGYVHIESVTKHKTQVMMNA